MTLTATVDGKEITLGAGTYENVRLEVKNGNDVVYDGTYTEKDREDEVADASGDASGDAGGMGGMGDMMMGGGGMPGGSDAGAASNCSHGDLAKLSSVSVESNDPFVAMVVMDGTTATVTGVADGETTVTVKVTLTSGVVETGVIRVVVGEGAESTDASGDESATQNTGGIAKIAIPVAAAVIVVGAGVGIGVKKRKKG